MFEVVYFYATLSPFYQRPLALESTGKNPGETVQSGSYGRQTFMVLKAIQFWNSAPVLAFVSPPIEQSLCCLPI